MAKHTREHPNFGEVYTAICNAKVRTTLLYTGPGSDALIGEIPNGTRIVVLSPLRPNAKGILALPLNYKQLEKKLVPESERQDPFYSGYRLTIDVKDIDSCFSKNCDVIVEFDDKQIQAKWKTMLRLSKNPRISDWWNEFQ